jgi:hypothetical protein
MGSNLGHRTTILRLRFILRRGTQDQISTAYLWSHGSHHQNPSSNHGCLSRNRRPETLLPPTDGHAIIFYLRLSAQDPLLRRRATGSTRPLPEGFQTFCVWRRVYWGVSYRGFMHGDEHPQWNAVSDGCHSTGDPMPEFRPAIHQIGGQNSFPVSIRSTTATGEEESEVLSAPRLQPPKRRSKAPFLSLALVSDGSIWCGPGELPAEGATTPLYETVPSRGEE